MTSRTIAAGVLTLAALAAYPAYPFDLRERAVFLMTNQVENAVIAFERLPNGALVERRTFSTGGAGDPVPQAGDRATNPLGSQGSLVLSDDGRFLYAVNAGSNQISVFEVRKTSLRLIEVQGSGGVRPISLTARGNILYVLNEVGTANVVGFTITPKGRLTWIPGSTRNVPQGAIADPHQIAFNPNGKRLAVTEKGTNQIVTWGVRPDGLLKAPLVTPSNGITPCGFAFDGGGHLIVSEAAASVDGASSLSSYRFLAGGVPEVVSASVPDLQTKACWVAVTLDVQFVYTSNTLSGEVSGYQLAADGTLTLLESSASSTSDVSYPTDIALSRDGQNLYVHLAGRKGIGVYTINPDGTLNRRRAILSMPHFAQGIAAN